MSADVQEVKLQDEGHKLALEQIHQVLAADQATAQRHLDNARQAKAIADAKYTTACKRLLKLAKPEIEVEDDATISSNSTEHSITVTHEPHAPAAPALRPKMKKGGKAT